MRVVDLSAGAAANDADSRPPIIWAERLYKRFGPLEVLRDISLAIRKGEVVSIIGPSGSGKSTLLRCFALLEEPSEGRI
jgi:ABC-type histidine transport system ATPase subunit